MRKERHAVNSLKKAVDICLRGKPRMEGVDVIERAVWGQWQETISGS